MASLARFVVRGCEASLKIDGRPSMVSITVIGDSVLVTRTALDTWHVQTQPAPNNRGVCMPSGPAYNLSVEFWVVSARQLP